MRAEPAPPSVAPGPELTPTPIPELEARRQRWGVGVSAGPFFFAFPLCSPLVGTEVRLGTRLGPRSWIVGTLGMAAGLSKWDHDTQLALWLSGGALAELAVGDRFLVSLGPVVALGVWGALSAYRHGDVSAAGLMPSVDLRLSVVLDRAGLTARRPQLTLGLDLLVLFALGTYHVERPGQGLSSVGPQAGLAVGVAPTLMLSYEAR